MKKFMIISPLLVLGVVYIIIVNVITSKEKVFTNNSMEIYNTTMSIIPKESSSETEEILNYLDYYINKKTTIYMGKVKYPTGDIGYLFLFNDNDSTSTKDILFKVVHNKRWNKISNGVIEESFDLVVTRDSDIFTIEGVTFSKEDAGGYIITSGLGFLNKKTFKIHLSP